MKRPLVFALVLLGGCGGSSIPSAPPTPPPPIYPNMLGGWGGTNSDTWVSTDGSVTGSRGCNETWLITSQTDGAFAGNFQTTPGTLADCALSGTVRGSVLVSGEIEFGHGDTGTTSQCVVVSDNVPARGVVSTNGNITAGYIVLLRCPYRGGTIDYRFTHSVSLSRR